MFHYIIWINFLSLSLSMAVMGLACFVFLEYRTKFLRYFIFLQALMIACIIANLLFEYLVTNLPERRALLIAWNVGNFIWSPFFLYSSLMYNLVAAGLDPSPRLSRFFKAFSALLFFPVLMPFLGGCAISDLVDELTRLSTVIVLPVCIFTSVFSLVVKSLRLRYVHNPFNRFIMVNSIVMNSVTAPALLFLFFTRPEGKGLYHTPLKLGIDLFFLVRSLLAVNYFRFFLVRRGPEETEALAQGAGPQTLRLVRFTKRSVNPGSLVDPVALVESVSPPEESRAMPEEDDRSAFDGLQALMKKERLHLDPDLDLPLLAKKAGLTRNRLSFVINACAGQSFNDYVNALRVAEAKAFMRSGKCSSVLEVAFESGFNSKATFYAAFKRATGLSPTEYRESREAASDEAGAGRA